MTIWRHRALALLILLLPAALFSSGASAQRIQPEVGKQLSPHVWMISSEQRGAVPNVGIVIGTDAVLVVDTGLGTANGAIILDEVKKRAPGRKIYVMATHWHPEHLGGEGAFPADAKIIRAREQQRDIDVGGMSMIDFFARRSDDMRALLDKFQFRKADILFDRRYDLDLGGVKVSLHRFGPAHTDGDTLVMVPGDGVLFAGDVVQNRYGLNFTGRTGTPQSWVAVLDEVEKLNAKIIVPAHSVLADASSIGENRAALRFIGEEAARLKQQGKSDADAAAELETAFKAKFPEWKNTGSTRSAIVKPNFRQ
jgi:glyoxylase-like metal-dependent hydrolase (beta-lactamase superfamily II)